LHGDIEEIALPGGICITRSDVHVLQPYETTSRHSSPLYMLVVHGKKQAVRTTLPAWLRHALAFNFIEGIHFNKQFAIRFQPLSA
ncbi:hypothetical protein ONQ97_27160, partial [Salmonella enterica subsp. enterica serovar Virginia]|nr:hypothetical protein [Salmonella enterica subsp. enterica serovar Virginia]